MDSHLSIIAGIVMLLLLSGFFSGAETALMSLSRAQVKRMSNGTPAERILFRLLLEPRRIIALVLVCNLFINVLLTALCATLLNGWLLGGGGRAGAYQSWVLPALERTGVGLGADGARRLARVLAVGLNIALVTPLLLVFGELSPKIMAYANNLPVARFSAVPLFYIGRVMRPVLWGFDVITQVLQRILRLGHAGDSWAMLSHDEVVATLAASEEGGVTSGQERELLERIIRLGGIEASEVMVPRTDMAAVPDTLTVREGFAAVRRSRHSFLAVYHGDLDDVWGVLAFKDYPRWRDNRGSSRTLAEFREPTAADGSGPVYPLQFVPACARVETLLGHLRSQLVRCCVVVGEYGETLGFLTVNSILEEIVGRFSRQTGNYDQLHPFPGGAWVADGRMRLRYLAERFRCIFPGESDTLGGLLMEQLGRVPRKGEFCRLPGWSFEVLRMNGQRVGSVVLKQENLAGEGAAGDA